MTTLRIHSKGTITLPAGLRKKYKLEEGVTLTIIDLDDGLIVLKPFASQVKKLADRIAKKLKEENITLDDLLPTLDETREKYY